ncbi:hypothetical protein GQ42DRAFT_158618 [Ramicandelaber brevisporus]|nr:hypothetical protein GQ42DRAFT_158618 [Ramicandelaber brevisporus]
MPNSIVNRLRGDSVVFALVSELLTELLLGLLLTAACENAAGDRWQAGSVTSLQIVRTSSASLLNPAPSSSAEIVNASSGSGPSRLIPSFANSLLSPSSHIGPNAPSSPLSARAHSPIASHPALLDSALISTANVCEIGREYARIPSRSIRSSSLDQAATIASWIESACGEPISKKYLRSLTVGISVTPHTPWLIVECYTFHIRYGGSNNEDATVVVGAGEDLEQAGIPLVSSNGTLSTTTTATAAKTGPPAAHSRSEVKAITQQLLRRLLVLTQSLPPLPSGRVLSMKLSYYPHTPADYEPSQFCADTEDGSMYRLSGAGEPLSVGQVESEHHSIGVGLLSCVESLAHRPEQQQQKQQHQYQKQQTVSVIEALPSQLAQLTQPTQILPNTQILPLAANNNNCLINNNSENELSTHAG